MAFSQSSIELESNLLSFLPPIFNLFESLSKDWDFKNYLSDSFNLYYVINSNTNLKKDHI